MLEGKILERFYDERIAAARIACPLELIPTPGRYLLAHDPASDSPLAAPLFPAGTANKGFLVAPPLPLTWTPGLSVSLQGPFGHGFALPHDAQNIALIALEDNPAPLLSLLPLALAQSAAVTLVCDSPVDGLPDEVEIQPIAALDEIWVWADYLAIAANRGTLSEWSERLERLAPAKGPDEAQLWVGAPIPCGGIAECGVCSIQMAGGVKLICKHGPVFPLTELLAAG